MQIEWLDAPPPVTIGKRPKRPKYYTISRKMMQNPGKWTVVMRDANVAAANAINKGGLVAFRPAGAYRAVSRRDGARAGRVNVYATYVGTPAPESETISLGIPSEDA